jgi:hypothetical protein
MSQGTVLDDKIIALHNKVEQRLRNREQQQQQESNDVDIEKLMKDNDEDIQQYDNGIYNREEEDDEEELKIDINEPSTTLEVVNQSNSTSSSSSSSLNPYNSSDSKVIF